MTALSTFIHIHTHTSTNKITIKQIQKQLQLQKYIHKKKGRKEVVFKRLCYPRTLSVTGLLFATEPLASVTLQ